MKVLKIILFIFLMLSKTIHTDEGRSKFQYLKDSNKCALAIGQVEYPRISLEEGERVAFYLAIIYHQGNIVLAGTKDGQYMPVMIATGLDQSQDILFTPNKDVPMGERLNVFVEQDLHLKPYLD